MSYQLTQPRILQSGQVQCSFSPIFFALLLFWFLFFASLLLLSSFLYFCAISSRPLYNSLCLSVCVFVCEPEWVFNDDLIALLSSSSPPQQLSKLHQLAMQQTPFTPLGQTTPAFPGTYPPTQWPSLPKILLSFLPVEKNTFSSSFFSLSFSLCLLWLDLSYLFILHSCSSCRFFPIGLCGALQLTWPAGGLLLLMLRFLLMSGFPLVILLE